MTAGFPRMVGDVGGTNARWAWQAGPGAALERVASYPCADFASLQAVIERYLEDQRLPRPVRLGFGIATPVDGDHIRMTNRAWSFSVADLLAALGVERCVVLNDFEAIAHSLPVLSNADVRRVGEGHAIPGAPLAVLGAGTGLGVAALVPTPDGDFVTIPGEGGHVTLAAANEREAAVIDFLRKRFGHASAERAVSGPGLVNLYQAICNIDAQPCAKALGPADVSARGMAGTDLACSEALRLFASFLGNVAGNLALTLGARGGVYVAGGVVPGLGAHFDALPFRQRFEDKGRFRAYLQRIPTCVIVAPALGLYGAARALEALDD